MFAQGPGADWIGGGGGGGGGGGPLHKFSLDPRVSSVCVCVGGRLGTWPSWPTP